MGILKVDQDLNVKKKLKISKNIQKGEEVFIIGSPFGVVSKSIFKNNISKGIISNIIGASKNHLLITDGRILPGSGIQFKVFIGNEGGGIFNKNEELVSICTIPLKRRDISVELNLGICLDVFDDEITPYLDMCEIKDNYKMDNAFHYFKNSLALIHVSYSWSSGIIISSNPMCTRFFQLNPKIS
jgi:hypothetical protein